MTVDPIKSHCLVDSGLIFSCSGRRLCQPRVVSLHMRDPSTVRNLSTERYLHSHLPTALYTLAGRWLETWASKFICLARLQKHAGVDSFESLTWNMPCLAPQNVLFPSYLEFWSCIPLTNQARKAKLNRINRKINTFPRDFPPQPLHAHSCSNPRHILPFTQVEHVLLCHMLSI